MLLFLNYESNVQAIFVSVRNKIAMIINGDAPLLPASFRPGMLSIAGPTRWAFKSVIPSVRYDLVSFRYSAAVKVAGTHGEAGKSRQEGENCIPRGLHSHRASNSPQTSPSCDNDFHAGVKSRENSEEAFSS